jgi:hypothetical protein
MPRMIDLMRASAVPANIMRSAAHGALSLPPDEVLEILVFLAKHPIFGEQARMTLAGWDEASSLAAASNPETASEVLEYMIARDNQRPRLVPALLENPSVSQSSLMEITATASPELSRMLLASARVRASAPLLRCLALNPLLEPGELQQVSDALAALGESLPDPQDVLEPELSDYLREHAAEIAAEEGKPFELVGGLEELLEDEQIEVPPAHATTLQAAAAVVARKPDVKPETRERVSTLQKIARLTVGERVQLSMKGNKDERFILIRDGCKVVSCAVLESPKLSDTEMTMFASMKNVQEAVLRGIANKRKFMKNYAVVRALANNPRCPLDVSLTLLGHLLVNDLKNLSLNKNVADTLRKLASKLFHEKSSTKKQG